MDQAREGHILVAVGTSGVGDAAVSYAVTEAARAGVGVHLVHILPPAGEGPGVIDGAERARLEVVGAYRLKIAARLARERSGGAVQVTAEMATGQAAGVLIERSAQARLVVLERPALVVLDGLLAPSVTRGLAVHASTPVVMVPPRWGGRSEVGAPVVIASIDDPAQSRVVIGAAIAAGQALQAKVEFVHSWWYADGEAEPVEGVADQRLSPRRAAEALLAASRRAELIVTARRVGGDGESRSPATGAALYQAVCPVLVAVAYHSAEVLAPRRRLSLVSGA
ncbi:hypothetical protein BH11ACT8_BH11ACT8_26010 [soil metagenome]